MVLSMSREFGVPMTADDFDGECHIVVQSSTYSVISFFSFLVEPMFSIVKHHGTLERTSVAL